MRSQREAREVRHMYARGRAFDIWVTLDSATRSW